MSEMLTYPLVENELFSSHWDNGWDILSEDKENEEHSEKGDEDEESRSQRVVTKGHDDDGQNGNRDDKEYEEDEGDVEQIREEISKVIENVMQTGIDQDNPSHFGIRPSSSPAKSRRRRHRPFLSRELNSSSRGMSADHLASSPPSTFEIQHDHQPIRGRKSHINRHHRQHESNKSAETIEYTPETETPNVSPTLRFSKTVPPVNTIRQESSEDRSGEEESSEEESSDEESVKAGFVETGLEVAEQEESSEEDSSEGESSEDEEESDEEDFVADDDRGPSQIEPALLEPCHTHNTKPSSSLEPSSSSPAMEPSSDPPFSFEDYTVLGDEADVKIYTICLEEYLDEMDDDHEALTETWLAKARLYQRPTLFPQSKYSTRDKPRKDPFANIKPSKTGRTVTLTGKAISQIRPRGEKTITTSARVSSSKAVSTEVISTEVPIYTHYTRIRANVLGINTRQLQVWPYFGEDVDDDGSIRERFDVIVEDRPRKVLISQQASTFGPYFLAFLDEIGCHIETILKYLLEAYEGPDGLLSRLTSFANDHKLARKLIRAKEKYCKDDFDRTSQRWVSVASSLPEINDETLWKAAVVCHAFWIRTNFSPWQLARKYAKFPDNNKIEGLVTFDKAKKYANVACSICQLHDCPFHGTMLERPDGREDSDEDDGNAVDALDVDYPPRVNFKELATAPLEREPPGRTSRAQPKKSLNWWMNEANSVTWDHSQRGPFFPCSHIGISCEDARCSCFEAKVCCEKTCGCSKSCTRRFEGCKCARRSKCCAQDDSCECFRMNRECDPDLCDACEAHVILNPVNRYDDDYLPRRCRNVAIQRSVPKRTLLGRSIVHGFGLYAGEPIAKDEFIGEYQGEIITRDETERRGAIYEFQKLSYIFDLNRDQTIDSQRMGNKIRFINHAAKSNQRNVYPKIMLCNLAHRIGMFAHRDIRVGEELFFDYGGSYHEKLYGEEEEKARKQKPKGNGKGKAVVTHIRPSRKSYQPPPEVIVEAPREVHDDTYQANININNHSSDSSDSEDDRPMKRTRRSRIPSPKRPKLPSPQKPSPLPKPKPTLTKFAARKTEDRNRVRGGSNASTPAVDKPNPLNLKAAMKSAHVPKPLNRRSRVVVDESEDESEGSDDEDMEVPRRSSRPRKASRKLREEDG